MGNAYARRISRADQPDETGEHKVTGIEFELHLEGDVKKTKKISWLENLSSNLIPVDLVSFDYLITKDKLEKGIDLRISWNQIPNSERGLLLIVV